MTLSRMGVGISALATAIPVVAPAQTSAEDLISAADELYAFADEACRQRGREIVVCARENEDDRYRLPFETVVPGDPSNEGVWGERERLQANPGTCQSASFFQVGCGSVGVSVGIGFGGDTTPRLGGTRRVGQ